MLSGSLPVAVLLAIVAVSLVRPSAIWAGLPVLLSVGFLGGFGVSDGIGTGGEIAKILVTIAFVASFSRIPKTYLLVMLLWTAAVLTTALGSDLGKWPLLVAVLGWIAPAAGAGVAMAVRRTDSARWFLRGVLMLQILTLVQILEIFARYSIPLVGGAEYKQYVIAGVGASNFAAAIACLGMAIAFSWPSKQQTITRVLIWFCGTLTVLLSMSKWSVVVLLVLLLLLAVRSLWQSTARGLLTMLGIVAVGLVVRASGVELSAVAEFNANGFDLASYSTGASRLEIWASYWQTFLDAPVRGAGLGWAGTSWGWPIHAHNAVLQLLGEGGLVLLVGYVCVVGWLVVSAWRKSGARVAALVAVACLSSAMEPAMTTPRYDLVLFAALGFLIHGLGTATDSPPLDDAAHQRLTLNRA